MIPVCVNQAPGVYKSDEKLLICTFDLHTVAESNTHIENTDNITPSRIHLHRHWSLNAPHVIILFSLQNVIHRT